MFFGIEPESRPGGPANHEHFAQTTLRVPYMRASKHQRPHFGEPLSGLTTRIIVCLGPFWALDLWKLPYEDPELHHIRTCAVSVSNMGPEGNAQHSLGLIWRRWFHESVRIRWGGLVSIYTRGPGSKAQYTGTPGIMFCMVLVFILPFGPMYPTIFLPGL